MAVIETLAVRVYIQHVGGSCAPCGRILIISHDRTPKQLVCTSLSLFVFFWFFLLILFIVFFLVFCTLVLCLRCITFMCILQQFVWLQKSLCPKKKKKASDPLACDIDFPSSDAILHSQEPMLYSQAGSVLT